jgi:hypothetical protein
VIDPVPSPIGADRAHPRGEVLEIADAVHIA